MKTTIKRVISLMLIIAIASCNTFTPSRGRVNKVSISPDGLHLAIASDTGVWFYDLSNGKLLQFQTGDAIIDIPYSSVADISWSPGGDAVAVSQDRNGVWIWDVKTWKLLTEKKGEADWRDSKGIPGFAWSPNSEQLALGTGGGNIWIWNKNSNTWTFKEKKIQDEGTQLGVLWMQDNHLTTVLGWNLYDVDTGEYIKSVNHWIDGIGRISWSPDETHLYFLFDLGGGLVDLNSDYVWLCCNTFAWSQTGQYFGAVFENSIYIIDTQTNERIFEEKQEDNIYALSWTPTDELLAVGIYDGELVLQNLHTKEIVLNLNEYNR